MNYIEDIVELEHIAFHAWPPREQKKLGGWILRANNGITGRANSVFTNGDPSFVDTEEAIKEAMRFYRDRGLSPRFQMTAASLPISLDEKLLDLGFVVPTRVSVQVAPIEKLVVVESGVPVIVNSQPNEQWLNVYSEVLDHDKFSLETRKGIINRITLDKAFASAIVNGDVGAIGLGVQESHWLGLFVIITIPNYRRKGLATAINQALASWAMRMGARKVYLQVEVTNKPALALYEGLEFEEHHQYWYRLLDD